MFWTSDVGSFLGSLVLFLALSASFAFTFVCVALDLTLKSIAAHEVLTLFLLWNSELISFLEPLGCPFLCPFCWTSCCHS